MMAAVIRLKRKACDEPADGLLIAVKKSKLETADTSKVLFKFAATLNNESESVRDQIEAALARESSKKLTKWRDPKDSAVSESTVKKLTEKIKKDHQNSVAKQRQELLNNRRLIVSDEFQSSEEDHSLNPEVRQLFHLYDIIEENEEVKKQNEEAENVITCNGAPLLREKVDDYVFDVYIAEREIDNTFLDRTVSVLPCSLKEDDIYFGDTDDSEECYEDDDDSNDENNWRNDYPDDADSPSGKGCNSDGPNSDSSCEEYDYDNDEQRKMGDALSKLTFDSDAEEDCDDLERSSFDYSKIMKELREEYSED